MAFCPDGSHPDRLSLAFNPCPIGLMGVVRLWRECATREASELRSLEATAVAAMDSVDRAGGADQALHKIMG